MTANKTQTPEEIHAAELLTQFTERVNAMKALCATIRTDLLASWAADNVVDANAHRSTIAELSKLVTKLRKNVHDDGLDVFRSTNGADKLAGVEKIEKRGKKADEADPFAV